VLKLHRWIAASALTLVGGAPTACAGPTSSTVPSTRPAASSETRSALSFTFATIDDQSDPAFNELLGLNNEGKLVGFYGNGSVGHPNRGYVVYHPYGQSNFRNVNYPSAADTQVASVNNKKALAGFYADGNGATFGFVYTGGIWYSFQEPHAGKGKRSVTEIFAINDASLAVGFYKDKSGKDYAFEVNVPTGVYSGVRPPGAGNAVATGITGRGDVAGYMTNASKVTVGFLLRQGTYTRFSYPGATSTKFLGITVHDQIVGSYVDSAGATHGFLLTNPLEESISWQPIDEPNAVGVTVTTGINQHDQIVGYYVDASGNRNGFLATPRGPR
jgi:hypothetical protein